LLKKTGRHLEVELDDIFRSTSKVLQVGTSLSKSALKLDENGQLVPCDSSQDSMPISELDDLLLNDKLDPVQQLETILEQDAFGGNHSSQAKTMAESSLIN